MQKQTKVWLSVVTLTVLMAGGFSNAYATTFPDMVLIDGTDPEGVPDFYIGKYEVTYGQYIEFRANDDQYHKVNNCPVERVSWYDAADYCNWLSSEKGLSPYYDKDDNYAELGSVGYRLPTADEYYKAAAWVSGNTYNTYGYGRDTIDGQDANYENSGDPYDDATTPVGYYDGTDHGGAFSTRGTANQYGLHDMSGNVWEWNNDLYDGRPNRGVRGGSWHDSTDSLASSGRPYDDPRCESSNVGFRVAHSVPEPFTILLLATGLVGVGAYRFRKKKKA